MNEGCYVHILRDWGCLNHHIGKSQKANMVCHTDPPSIMKDLFFQLLVVYQETVLSSQPPLGYCLNWEVLPCSRLYSLSNILHPMTDHYMHIKYQSLNPMGQLELSCGVIWYFPGNELLLNFSLCLVCSLPSPPLPFPSLLFLSQVLNLRDFLLNFLHANLFIEKTNFLLPGNLGFCQQ